MEDMESTSPPVSHRPASHIYTSAPEISEPAAVSLFHNDTSGEITNATKVDTVGFSSIADESVYGILLGVSVIAVLVTIVLISVVVLRYISHQKGTYYTYEESLVFKSDPEMLDMPESPDDEELSEDQDDQEDPEDKEDPEEEEP